MSWRDALTDEIARKKSEKKDKGVHKPERGIHGVHGGSKSQPLRKGKLKIETENERVQRRLEEKTRIYEELCRGKQRVKDAPEENQRLVDFEAKAYERITRGDVDAEEVPEGYALVEETDEFGRIREVVREVEAPILVRYGEQTEFPVYRRQEAGPGRQRKGEHYDGANDSRAKGAAYYRLSQDEDERRAQMDALKGYKENDV